MASTPSLWPRRRIHHLLTVGAAAHIGPHEHRLAAELADLVHMKAERRVPLLLRFDELLREQAVFRKQFGVL